MDDETDTVRFTVGRLEVQPNSPNTVPGRALFTVDLRHPDPGVLARLGACVEETCRANARGCDVAVAETFNAPPTRFDAKIIDAVDRAATRLDLPRMRIFSGAFHDAKYLAEICPAGMIFVPCAGGVSHNPRESAHPADLAAGARVLAEVLVDLAS
jgi:N-carbamoyl-L-amino-acid hydrolase